jgi:hypothetical protein
VYSVHSSNIDYCNSDWIVENISEIFANISEILVNLPSQRDTNLFDLFAYQIMYNTFLGAKTPLGIAKILPQVTKKFQNCNIK